MQRSFLVGLQRTLSFVTGSNFQIAQECDLKRTHLVPKLNVTHVFKFYGLPVSTVSTQLLQTVEV